MPPKDSFRIEHGDVNKLPDNCGLLIRLHPDGKVTVERSVRGRDDFHARSAARYLSLVHDFVRPLKPTKTYFFLCHLVVFWTSTIPRCKLLACVEADFPNSKRRLCLIIPIESYNAAIQMPTRRQAWPTFTCFTVEGAEPPSSTAATPAFPVSS